METLGGTLTLTGAFDNMDEAVGGVLFTGSFRDDGVVEDMPDAYVNFFGQFWPVDDLEQGRYRR